MNTLVVYDSQYGNTEKVAAQIAEALKEHSDVRMSRAGHVSVVDLRWADLLLVGGPTQGHGLSPAMSEFFERMESIDLDGMTAAAFDTRLNLPGWMAGSAATKIGKRLKKMGAYLLVEPSSFFVSGTEGPLESDEANRASRWAEGVFQVAEALRPMAGRV